eukprot:Clim_evm10s242 gene=Clim_evmTU10s242
MDVHSKNVALFTVLQIWDSFYEELKLHFLRLCYVVIVLSIVYVLSTIPVLVLVIMPLISLAVSRKLQQAALQERAWYRRVDGLDGLRLRLALMDRDFTAEDYEDLILLDQANEKKRLTEETINSLPSRKVDLETVAKGEKCTICLEHYEAGEELRELQCGADQPHIYHKMCIDQWLTTSVTCPLCKVAIPDTDMVKGSSSSPITTTTSTGGRHAYSAPSTLTHRSPRRVPTGTSNISSTTNTPIHGESRTMEAS